MGRINPPPQLEPVPVPAKTVAQRMIDAAICAYAIGPDTYDPIPFFRDAIEWQEGPKVIRRGEGKIDAGLVGVMKDGWAVLSLRGTLSSFNGILSFIDFFEDWRQDDETLQVPFNPPGSDGFGCVHQGFHEAVTEMWPDIETYLSGCDWPKLKGLRITGHSKGAGMAFLCAVLAHFHLASLQQGGPQRIEVHAFAAPLAGNAEFHCQYEAAGLHKVTIRHQRESDLVPFLPAYDKFDVLDKWPFERENPTLDLVRVILKRTHRHYALAGEIAFYIDQSADKKWHAPIKGAEGQGDAERAILYAIYNEQNDRIAAAHSAINSYWPSIFERDLPSGVTEELATVVLKNAEAYAKAALAGD